jgi:glycosyltransferase involved in cell wall biosynthesis
LGFSKWGGSSSRSVRRDSSRPIVLTIGRFAYQKNLEMFVWVAALVSKTHPQAQFKIMGAGFAGPLEQGIRAIIAHAQLQRCIAVLPWTSRTEVLRELDSASVFALTSRFEGMTNTLLEALHLGTPTVVTDVDGSRDVLRSGRGGFVTPLNDDEAMAAKIRYLLDNPDAGRQMGDSGRRWVREAFDIKRSMAALSSLYLRLADGTLDHVARE